MHHCCLGVSWMVAYYITIWKYAIIYIMNVVCVCMHLQIIAGIYKL